MELIIHLFKIHSQINTNQGVGKDSAVALERLLELAVGDPVVARAPGYGVGDVEDLGDFV